MAGSVLAAGILGVVGSLAFGLAIVGGASVTAQRAAGAADAAALAAADAASGAVQSADGPCELAARVAEAAGARLTGCVLDGFVATVKVQAAYAGLAAVAHARAGPPEGQ